MWRLSSVVGLPSEFSSTVSSTMVLSLVFLSAAWEALISAVRFLFSTNRSFVLSGTYKAQVGVPLEDEVAFAVEGDAWILDEFPQPPEG
jgi:hypothetical protein